LDLIAANHFNPDEPGVFAPIIDALLRYGDYYLHLADLKSYGEAHERVGELYADKEEWSCKAILNIAASGKFSSDRTILEYASQIWRLEPCLPVSNATPA
jgi:starch phosphorylase